mmetsp:Transcript_22343/g.35864  ORF Transcript_22343/g.35864 Transcript_22343/m.35864 type:complete len:211 (-) Transcript_22343:557-1189(-)
MALQPLRGARHSLRHVGLRAQARQGMQRHEQQPLQQRTKNKTARCDIECHSCKFHTGCEISSKAVQAVDGLLETRNPGHTGAPYAAKNVAAQRVLCHKLPMACFRKAGKCTGEEYQDKEVSSFRQRPRDVVLALEIKGRSPQQSSHKASERAGASSERPEAAQDARTQQEDCAIEGRITGLARVHHVLQIDKLREFLESGAGRGQCLEVI